MQRMPVMSSTHLERPRKTEAPPESTEFWLPATAMTASVTCWASIYLYLVSDSFESNEWKGESEYDPRSHVVHWKLSLVHSVMVLLGSAWLLFRDKKPWWDGSNASRPKFVAICAFSASYFLVDTFFLASLGYVVHHIVSMAGASVTLCSRRFVKLFVMHLFFAECGNVVFIAEHVWYSDGAWGQIATLWFAVTRVLWICCTAWYQWRAMLSSRLFPRWGIAEWAIIVLSSVLNFGNFVYTCMFVQYELFHISPH